MTREQLPFAAHIGALELNPDLIPLVDDTLEQETEADVCAAVAAHWMVLDRTYRNSAKPPLTRPLLVDVSDDDIIGAFLAHFRAFFAPLAALRPISGALMPVHPAKDGAAPSKDWTVQTASAGLPCSWPTPGT